MNRRYLNLAEKKSRSDEERVIETTCNVLQKTSQKSHVVETTRHVVQTTSLSERAENCIADPFIADAKDWQDVLEKPEGGKYEIRSIQRWRSRQESLKDMTLIVQILFFAKRFIAKRRRYFDPLEDAIDRELLNIYGGQDPGSF